MNYSTIEEKQDQNLPVSFWKSLDRSDKYIVCNLYGAYFVLGFCLILLGAVLPMMKTDYALTYQIGGLLLSMQSVGSTLFGFLAGYFPIFCGLKNSFVGLTACMLVGMVMLLISGNPVWLLLAMGLIGVSRGAITNYNNQIMSEKAKGNGGPLNLLHAFYAIGACVAPIAVLICNQVSASGWRLPVLIAIVLTVLSLLSMLGMQLENSRGTQTTEPVGRQKVSYGFFRERMFWIAVFVMFFYQCIESVVMGWITTFFVDSNMMTNNSAQAVTAVLWIAILTGRISCSKIALRFRPYQMLVVMTIGQLIFSVLLAGSHSLTIMLAATVGLGFSMSGMAGTLIANAGDLFARYPVCMGYFLLFTSSGAVVAPAVVGALAESIDMRFGMAVLVVSAVALLIGVLYNAKNQTGGKHPIFRRKMNGQTAAKVG